MYRELKCSKIVADAAGDRTETHRPPATSSIPLNLREHDRKVWEEVLWVARLVTAIKKGSSQCLHIVLPVQGSLARLK